MQSTTARAATAKPSRAPSISSGPAHESLPLFKEGWTPVLVFDVLVAFISLRDVETSRGTNRTERLLLSQRQGHDDRAEIHRPMRHDHRW
jgi:hypothetical protein